MIAATAPQWPAKYSISAAAERVLVVTAMAPSSTQANQASIASMQLSRWISDIVARLDAAPDQAGGKRADPLVKFAVGLQFRAGASNGAQIRNGWSRRALARIRSSHGTSMPANGPTMPGAGCELVIVSSRAALAAAFGFACEYFCATGSRGGQFSIRPLFSSLRAKRSNPAAQHVQLWIASSLRSSQ